MEDLKKVFNFFEKLSQKSQLQLVDLLSKKEYYKGDFIIKEGDLAENFYVLTKGVVRSYVTDKNDKEHTRTLFVPITTTGSISGLILNKPSDLSYECLTDCEMYSGNYTALKKLAKTELDFANLYNAVLQKILLKMVDKIYDLSVLDATERYLKLKREIPEIENLIAQYHIASYLNITPVQLSRIRKKIIEEKLY